MLTNDPGAIAGALGIIEDTLTDIEIPYSTACAYVAEFSEWRRATYLAMKAEMDKAGLLDDAKTETAVKDLVEAEMRARYPQEFGAFKTSSAEKARGEARFKNLDTRRSIGQTLVKILLRDEDSYGQGGMGQHGVGS